MSLNLPPIPAAKRPRTTLIKARIRNDIKTGSFNPAILISLQTRQEQLSRFDMFAKNTGGWGPHFIGEQSKYSVILNGTSSSAGTPACVLFSAGRAQERSSPSKLSRSLFFSPSSASEATTVTSATKTDLQTVVSQSRRSSWSIFLCLPRSC